MPIATKELTPFVWPDPHRFIEHVTRARAQGITLSPLPRFKTIMAASSSRDPRVAYFVDEHMCSCMAGRLGNLCKHRAFYIFTNLERVIADHGLPDWHEQNGHVKAAS